MLAPKSRPSRYIKLKVLNEGSREDSPSFLHMNTQLLRKIAISLLMVMAPLMKIHCSCMSSLILIPHDLIIAV